MINSKGVISPRQVEEIISPLAITNRATRGTNGAANHETVLAQEGVEITRGSLGERTVDFRVYGWFPNELPSRQAEMDAESASGDDDESGLFV